ncbi:unnamed protein product, partial [Rotaria sp. Silwood1]
KKSAGQRSAMNAAMNHIFLDHIWGNLDDL